MKLKQMTLTVSILTISVLTIAQVRVISDIDYVPNTAYANDKDVLDIYMPEGAHKAPVIVYFHGGALLQGDKSWGKELGMRLAQSGIGLVSANYRLSPDFHHPAHIKDAAAATAWVILNIAEYGGDASKVFVGGHSAGAYLAAALAVNPSYMDEAGPGHDQLTGAVLISAFLYVEETAQDRTGMDDIYKTIWGMDPEVWLQASVSPYIGSARDNVLLICADGDEDWRKKQNMRFSRAIKDAGQDHIFYHEVPNRNHMTLISAILDEDDHIVNLILDFVLGR